VRSEVFLALRVVPAALLAAALLSALSGLLRLLAGVLLAALATLPALTALLPALSGLLGLLARFRILRIGIVHQALLFSHLASVNGSEPRMFPNVWQFKPSQAFSKVFGMSKDTAAFRQAALRASRFTTDSAISVRVSSVAFSSCSVASSSAAA
jgi:hypothetical protein